MLPLVFHNSVESFGKLYRLNHYLPMYYTARHGGISTQFWGRYTPHLPIDYKAGKRPRATVDWRPWEFKPGDLVDADWVLVGGSEPGDPRRVREASDQVTEYLRRANYLHACDGRWCLFRVRK
jgi:hypothetical protein